MTFIIICIVALIVTLIYLLYINKYPNKETIFYSSNDYPQAKLLEENWQLIKNEIPPFQIEKIKIKRNKDVWDNQKMLEFTKILEKDPQWFKSWDNTNVWYSYPLMYHNKVVGKVAEICPETIKLLNSFQNVRIAGFSLLTPLGELEKHKDDTGPNFRSMALNMNLTGDNCALLIKPNNSNKFLKHLHKKGKAVIFNAEQLHYAVNYDDKIRIILYVDFFTK